MPLEPHPPDRTNPATVAEIASFGKSIANNNALTALTFGGMLPTLCAWLGRHRDWVRSVPTTRVSHGCAAHDVAGRGHNIEMHGTRTWVPQLTCDLVHDHGC
jgi:hypothetical protein